MKTIILDIGDESADWIKYFKKSKIQKAKVYIKNPQDAPQGTKVEEGDRGGLFYESLEQAHFESEVGNIAQKIKETMKFSDDESQQAETVIKKHESIIKNEFNKVLSAVGGGVSYRIKNKYSILEKAKRKNYKISDMQDVIGMRIEVNNVDDIYNAVKKLEQIYGEKIITKEDYIRSPKGVYRAYHMNIKYADGIYGELQIRTPLMDKIANTSHALLYKNTINIDTITRKNIEDSLEIYSDISINKKSITDLKLLPKTKKILGGFEL